MDTHISTLPDIEADIVGMSVRLPGEANGVPATEDHLPASTLRQTGRRRTTLLAGAAVAAVAVSVGGAFLISPYNHFFPAPRLQASVNSAANYAQGKLRPILAPSASLAKVSVPPATPVTNETYTPKPRDQEISELVSLHPGTKDQTSAGKDAPAKLDGQPGKAAPAQPGVGTTALVRPGLEPVEVPHEPGSSTILPSATRALSIPSASSSAVPSFAPANAAPRDATAKIIASLNPGQPEAPVDANRIIGGSTDNPAVSRPTEPQPVSAISQPAADNPALTTLAPSPPRQDAIGIASNLRAAPMSQPEQVQVLNLVTEMAAMVKDLRKQQSQLRADLSISAADMTGRLTDYERRLALAEARSALAAVADGSSNAAAGARTQPASDQTPVELKPAPLSATRVVAVVPVPSPPLNSSSAQAASPKLYRVQAASPGLALLAQVDRGGGDGAQLQVIVGDTVPEYGRVKSIAQKGTAWVVTTEHGAIQ
jgi:hypothetical protein